MRSSLPDLSNEFVIAIHPFEVINLNDSTPIQSTSLLQEGKYKNLILMFYLLLKFIWQSKIFSSHLLIYLIFADNLILPLESGQSHEWTNVNHELWTNIDFEKATSFEQKYTQLNTSDITPVLLSSTSLLQNGI